jgi:hypothetical protein
MQQQKITSANKRKIFRFIDAFQEIQDKLENYGFFGKQPSFLCGCKKAHEKFTHNTEDTEVSPNRPCRIMLEL